MLCLGLAVALLAAGPVPASSPTPACSPAPEAPGGRLRLDVERHVECTLQRDPTTGLLRLEERVEVTARSPQALLQRFLKPEDVRGGPEVGPGGLDVLPLLKAALSRDYKGPFYLYLLTTPLGRSAQLREKPIPASGLVLPGAIYEPFGRFETVATARAALRQLEARIRTPRLPGPELVGPPAP